MPSNIDKLTYIDISDFSHGISSPTEGAIAAAGDGVAENAINCLPGPNGVGLVPGPKVIATYDLTGPTTTTLDPNFPFAAILDAQVVGAPISQADHQESVLGASGSERVDSWDFPPQDEIGMVIQSYEMAANAQKRRSRVVMFHIGAGVLSASAIANAGSDRTFTAPTNAANPFTFHVSNTTYGPATVEPVGMFPSLGAWSYSHGMLAVIHVGAADAAQVPYAWLHTQMWSWAGLTPGGGGFTSGWYPLTNDASIVPLYPWYNPYTGSGTFSELQYALEVNSTPIMAFSHQGRGVAVTDGKYAAWGGTIGNSFTEYSVQIAQSLRFSEPGGAHDPSKWENFSVILEPMGGIASYHSLSSDDLFLLGQTGGAVRMKGPLPTSTIVRHPMLPSGFGRATHIAPTPEGLVWGTRHGVWLWQGGDTATNMAPQLAYDFWWDDATMGRWAYQQPKGRPVCHYPYLFFPNGWICDMRFKSWFRIGDQHPPSGTRPVHWTLASNGDVLGVQAGHLLNGPFTDKVAMTRFDPTQYGINWFWSSQPLAKTRNRILNFREVAFTVHNPTTAQTVQFSAYGTQADGTLGTYNHNFSVPVSPRPQTIRFGMSLDVGDVQFSINNFSTNGTGPALSLHRISLGFVDQQSVKAI